jgi:hypothetical protein
MGTERARVARSPHAEPLGFTLADLAALVLGVALVAALPLYTPPNSQLSGVPSAWWYWPLHLARECIGKACLALVPVLLARCARYRRLARSAEFLAAFCALPWLTSAIDRLPAMLVTEPVPGVANALQAVPSELFWRWKEGQLAVGVIAAFAFALGRKRLPGWALSVLLILVWLGLINGAELFLERVASAAIDFELNERATEMVAFGVAGPILFLLYGVPAMASLLTSNRRTWLDWTGMSLAAALFLTSEIVFHAADWATQPPSFLWPLELVFVAVMLASTVLSLFIVRRLGPAWSDCVATR